MVGMVINLIVGVYIPIIRIPVIKGGMTIPNIATFDHGTYTLIKYFFWTIQPSIYIGPLPRNKARF